VPIKPENQRLSASICVQFLAPKANPEFCQSTSELIAADSLNPLYSLSYSANCRPGQLHLNHLLARDPFDKLRAGSQIPAMCGLIGPQDGDLAIPSEQVWLKFRAWTQLTTRKSSAQATV